MNSSRGIRYSAFLHAALVFFMVFGLPDFLHRQPDPEPEAISVDILPIAPISNVKPQDKAPEKVEEKKPPQEKVEKKPTPPAHKEEPKPEPKPEPLPVKKPLPKKEEKKKPEKKEQKKPDESLDSILKSVKDSAKAEEAKKPKEQTAAQPSKSPAKSSHFDASMPLSMSEKDAIRSQIESKWSPPAGAKDAYNLQVTLRISVSADGTVTDVKLAKDEGRYNSDSFFRAAADSAMRAVHAASPLKNLAADKYGAWQDMELTFDPKDMLY